MRVLKLMLLFALAISCAAQSKTYCMAFTNIQGTGTGYETIYRTNVSGTSTTYVASWSVTGTNDLQTIVMVIAP